LRRYSAGFPNLCRHLFSPWLLKHLHGRRAISRVMIVGKCKYLDSPIVNGFQKLDPFGYARNPPGLQKKAASRL
jgi:hypothetical protein